MWRPVKQETSSLSVSDHGSETLRVHYTLSNMNIVGLWLISIWFTWSFIKLFAWYNLYVFDNNFVWVLFLVRWRTLSGQTTSILDVVQWAFLCRLRHKNALGNQHSKAFPSNFYINLFSISYQHFEPGKEVNNPAQVNINHNDRLLRLLTQTPNVHKVKKRYHNLTRSVESRFRPQQS